MIQITEDQLIDLVWQTTNNGSMPHDRRQTPIISSSWTCPQCGTVLSDFGPNKSKETPCTVDWRFELHKERIIEDIAKWKKRHFDINAFVYIDKDYAL